MSSKMTKRALAAIIVFLAVTGIALTVGIELALPPPNRAINVVVNSDGGYLQNVTVSCYGCVPFNDTVWVGTMTVGGTRVKMTDNTMKSTGISFYLGGETPKPKNSACASEFYTNSSCVYELGPFPFAFSFQFLEDLDGWNL